MATALSFHCGGSEFASRPHLVTHIAREFIPVLRSYFVPVRCQIIGPIVEYPTWPGESQLIADDAVNLLVNPPSAFAYARKSRYAHHGAILPQREKYEPAQDLTEA